MIYLIPLFIVLIFPNYIIGWGAYGILGILNFFGVAANSSSIIGISLQTMTTILLVFALLLDRKESVIKKRNDVSILANFSFYAVLLIFWFYLIIFDYQNYLGLSTEEAMKKMKSEFGFFDLFLRFSISFCVVYFSRIFFVYRGK